MPRRMTHAERERFLAGRHVAVLVTIGPSGLPLPTPIWYRYRNGLFYFRTAERAVKVGNIRRDPRVSICIQDERPPYKATIVWGTAEIEHGHEWLANETPRHYLGFAGGLGYKRAGRPTVEEGRPAVALVVRPERITTFDYSKETPLIGRVWLVISRFLPPWL